MASLNVEEWTPEQVAEWMSGLGDVGSHAWRCISGGLCGRRLLLLAPDTLHSLGVTAIGHQEIILEAVDALRHFHYESSRLCVSTLALQLSAAARALAALPNDGQRLDSSTLCAVARAVRCAKALAARLAAWRAPPPLPPRPAHALLKLALEAATCAQRDRFAECPTVAVLACARALAAAADSVLHELHEPAALTPPSLVAVTVQPKRPPRPRGVVVRPAAGGCGALVAKVALGSAAGALLPGDELVCVNGRVVVGWECARVQALCASRRALVLRVTRHARPPPALTTRPQRLLEPDEDDIEEASPEALTETAALSSDSGRRRAVARRHSLGDTDRDRWLNTPTHTNSLWHSRGRLDKSHSSPATAAAEFSPQRSNNPPSSPRLQYKMSPTTRAPPVPHTPPHYPPLRAVERPPHSEHPSPRLLRAPPTPTPSNAEKADVETALALLESPTAHTGSMVSVKKTTSLLSRRRVVPARALVGCGAARGAVWQRVRGGGGAPRWAHRQLMLAVAALYAYRSSMSNRACLRIRLQGCTVAEAKEVKSKEHAFKVYHTGHTIYFAAATRAAMLAWLQLISTACMSTPHPPLDPNTQFSETEYSETESDPESSVDTGPDKRGGAWAGAWGGGASLRRLARLARSESADSVRHNDVKYLKIFTRHRRHDKQKKSKLPVLVPPPLSPGSPPPPLSPTPPPPRARPPAPLGFQTLEQFMLDKQDEERKQVYVGRVVLGVGPESPNDGSLARRLRKVIPDVVYGETPTHTRDREKPPTDSPKTPKDMRDASNKDEDGYEQLPFDSPTSEPEFGRLTYAGVGRGRRVHSRPSAAATHKRAPQSWSLAGETPPPAGSSGGTRLRLTDTQHSTASGSSGSGLRARYPQCPPTFEEEPYTPARGPPPPPPPRPPKH